MWGTGEVGGRSYSSEEEHPGGLEVQEEVTKDERGHDRKGRSKSLENIVRVLDDNGHHQTSHSLSYRRPEKMKRRRDEGKGGDLQ
jgi:hypothetical protein